MLNKKLKLSALKVDISTDYKVIVCSLFALVILVVFYYPVATLPLDFFHNDDARLMAELNNLDNFRSTINFIFSLEFFKFRPISNLQYVMENLFFANNLKAYLIYNIFLVVALNYIFLQFFYKKQSLFVCILITLVIVTSRLFNYSIWNITGSFETLAAIIFLLIVFFLVEFANDKKTSIKRLIFLGLMLIFTSERYLPFLVMLPVLYHYLNSNESFYKSIFKGAIYSVAILMIYLIFRKLMQVPFVVGTQTDDISTSFSVLRFCEHILRAYLEIFSFTLGPRYLTGFEFPVWVPFNALVANKVWIIGFFISIFILLLSVYYFFFKCFIKEKTTLVINLISLGLVMAASITFRLELRWLLAPYLMILLFFVSNRTALVNCKVGVFNVRMFDRTLFFSIVFLTIIYNSYYAIFFRRELYFAEKLQDASLINHLWMYLNG